jgi:hypothetical protein
MYFKVETAKGARQCKLSEYSIMNSDVPWITIKPKVIKKGEKCLVFTNGTIGQGARSYNYSKDKAIALLKRLINELESDKTDEEILDEKINEACKACDEIPF